MALLGDRKIKPVTLLLNYFALALWDNICFITTLFCSLYKPKKGILARICTLVSPSRLWSLQTSPDPSWWKVSVEPAAGSNPCPDCQRPAEQGLHTRDISAAISNTHIITYTAQLLTVWRGRGSCVKVFTTGRFRLCYCWSAFQNLLSNTLLLHS